MSDQVDLERRYRRLLAWYPPEFRRDKGEELLAVLMACAPEGHRRPGLSASADLIKNGLWMRLNPSVPRSAPTVRAALRLMYAGAAVTFLSLMISILSLAFIGGAAARLRLLGHSQPLPVAITVGVLAGLVLISLWLWMAQANGRGRNWARMMSTVLVGLATLHLFGIAGVVQVVFSLVTWLLGLAAVWLLWRPASNAFFTPTEHSTQPSTRAN
jgi:hypothetical protein